MHIRSIDFSGFERVQKKRESLYFCSLSRSEAFALPIFVERANMQKPHV